MIQPVSAFSPRAGFRGSAKKSQKSSQEKTRSQIALINAASTSVAAGALTTIVARSYTSSWSHAGVLGLCGGLLTMLFTAPLLVENTSILKSPKKSTVDVQASNSQASSAVKVLRPAKRLVQFRQS